MIALGPSSNQRAAPHCSFSPFLSSSSSHLILFSFFFSSAISSFSSSELSLSLLIQIFLFHLIGRASPLSHLSSNLFHFSSFHVFHHSFLFQFFHISSNFSSHSPLYQMIMHLIMGGARLIEGVTRGRSPR